MQFDWDGRKQAFYELIIHTDVVILVYEKSCKTKTRPYSLHAIFYPAYISAELYLCYKV